MDMTYFNAEKTRDNLVQWIKDWFDKNGPTSKAVLGISGGKDSTIAAALCARAIGKERVLGVLMPNGEQKDISDSIAVCNALGIPNITINIKDYYEGVAELTCDALNEMDSSIKKLSEQTLINLAPRLRMTTLYAVSQTVKGRVVNTSNLSEFLTGYFTKNGDSCGDLKPLLRLTKNEVVAIGLTMPEIPRHLVEKTPADGLSEQTDEDKIGFSYDDLDTLIRGNFKGCPNPIDVLPVETLKKIQDRMNAVEFKTKPEEIFQDIELN
jgi:NAD+ synthase